MIYFDNLIEINIKNIPNKYMIFFKLHKCNIFIKYYDQEFLFY